MKIGVVINAYNRREYLIEAVNSVMNCKQQERIGIYVIKNFIDERIDQYLKENKITTFLIDSNRIGERVAKIIQYLDADIISFLDDDDLFLPNKIQIVNQIFMKYPDLVYYHNSHVVIDSDGNIIYGGKKSPIKWFRQTNKSMLFKSKERANLFSNLLRYHADFNSSSISIKKNVLLNKLESMKKITVAFDSLLLYLALDSDGDILIDQNILTKFRFHPSTTNILHNREMRREISKIYYDDMQAISVSIDKNSVSRLFTHRLSETKIILFYLVGVGKLTPQDFITMIIWGFQSVEIYPFKIALACLLGVITFKPTNFISSLFYSQG